jgi:general secretion pathway protein E
VARAEELTTAPVAPTAPAAGTGEAQEFLRFVRDKQWLTGATADRVERVRRDTGDSVALILLNSGLLSEDRLAAAMSEWSSLPFVQSLSASSVDYPVEYVHFFRTHEVAPATGPGREPVIACWDVLDEFVPRALRFVTGSTPERVVATRATVLEVLNTLWPSDGVAAPRADSGFEDEQVDRLKDLASEEPVIRLAHRIVSDAMSRKASDIHFEPTESGLQIRFRTDGLLQVIETHPKHVAAPIISRIKVMAGLNIAERRLPQDGRIRVTVQGKETDFRVATSPTLHGESVVLRILDRQDVALDFEALGFDSRFERQLRECVSRPYGIVLITGPTGSGKTTTLYAALKSINTAERKILTVEDPVEYTLEGINQVPVRPEIGLTFARALRSFLRQDPDVLMVGEIRDRETAEIAVQAALTGHLLLSTLHTNSAAAAITRLLDMGLDDYLLTSTLDLVVAQRLVRKLCVHCRKPYEASEESRQYFGLNGVTALWYRPVGCAQCQHTGWRGRTAIVEALQLNDELRAKILARADAHSLESQAVRLGMTTLNQHGLQLVNDGITTAQELLRVTRLS